MTICCMLRPVNTPRKYIRLRAALLALNCKPTPTVARFVNHLRQLLGVQSHDLEGQGRLRGCRVRNQNPYGCCSYWGD